MAADDAQTRQKAAELARQAAELAEVWKVSPDSGQRAEAAQLEAMSQRLKKIAAGEEANDGTIEGVPLDEIGIEIEIAAWGSDYAKPYDATNDTTPDPQAPGSLPPTGP